MSDDARDISLAKSASFRFLKIRERSVAEMREKLLLKGFDSKIVEITIDFLKEKKFLDDDVFARHWIRYRQSRPMGPQRIRMELRQKGVCENIISEQLALAFEGEDQQKIVTDLANRRALRMKHEEPIKRKKKVFDFLARRGFSLELIKKAVKGI